MKFHRQSPPRSAVALTAAFLITFLAGCASPGPARPPSLHLPHIVTDLTATRTGDNVTLHWTTPDKTTDGLKVPATLTAEICRESPKPSSTCTPIKRLTVHPGPTVAFETLPNALTTGPTTLLTYRVRLLNARDHSAGLSSPAFAAAGTAPQQVEHLQATPVRGGAMLEWQPQATKSVVELDRTLVQTTVSHKAATKQPLQPASVPTEVHLRAGKPSSDHGGTIDPTALRGETYRYTAQRVLYVALGGHDLQIHSIPSPAITVTMRDTFPPKAPASLAAVPGDHTIDLSWEPNTEPDLAGYIVYRQPVTTTGAATGSLTRLTPTPIQTPAFSDSTVQPGQIYSYRVSAIDTAGNEGPPSNEAKESLRNQ